MFALLPGPNVPKKTFLGVSKKCILIRWRLKILYTKFKKVMSRVMLIEE